MAVDTTWSMFIQLLKESLDADTGLSDTLKAALKARCDALTPEEHHVLSSANVESSTGVTVDEATDSITVPDAASGEITWDLITFDTPVRIDGTIGGLGVLIGHVGQGSNTPVAEADITLQYRESSTGVWKAFGRTVVIDEVSTVQFKATIATQTGDHDMPQLHILAEQL
jgi:hypothetical protein